MRQLLENFTVSRLSIDNKQQLRTRCSAITERPHNAQSFEILSTAAPLYDKSHLKRIAIGE